MKWIATVWGIAAAGLVIAGGAGVAQAESARSFLYYYAPFTPRTVCPFIYAPVCGANGQTFSNECFANMARVPVAFEGACNDPVAYSWVSLPAPAPWSNYFKWYSTPGQSAYTPYSSGSYGTYGTNQGQNGWPWGSSSYYTAQSGNSWMDVWQKPFGMNWYR